MLATIDWPRPCLLLDQPWHEAEHVARHVALFCPQVVNVAYVVSQEPAIQSSHSSYRPFWVRCGLIGWRAPIPKCRPH